MASVSCCLQTFSQTLQKHVSRAQQKMLPASAAAFNCLCRPRDQIDVDAHMQKHQN